MLKSVLLYPSKSSGIFRQCSKFKLAIPPSAEVCNNTNVKIVYNADPTHAQFHKKLEHFILLRKHAMNFKKSREKLNLELTLTILTEFLGLKKRFEMCQFLIYMRNQRRRWHTVTVFENHTKKSHFTVSQFFTENYKLGLRYFFDFRSENSKAKKNEMRHFCWFLNTVKLWNCLD